MNALMDCPFCGMEEPHMGIDGVVTCGNCGAKGPWDKDAYDGAGNEQEMWNKRDSPWCNACKEPDCCVSGDGTCAMIRKYLSLQNVRPLATPPLIPQDDAQQ